MTRLNAKYLVALSSGCLVAGAACNRNQKGPLPEDDLATTTGGSMNHRDDDDHDEAEAELKAAEGNKLDGEAKFTATESGVRIVVEVEDAPSGSKGIHIHEKGDCSDIAGKSMGDHFAPDGHDHALPNQGMRHLGDLGNIEVGENGKGRLEITVEGANLKKGDQKSFLGKSLVIHETTDKGSAEQPSGASGKPMACGVIHAD